MRRFAIAMAFVLAACSAATAAERQLIPQNARDAVTESARFGMGLKELRYEWGAIDAGITRSAQARA